MRAKRGGRQVSVLMAICLSILSVAQIDTSTSSAQPVVTVPFIAVDGHRNPMTGITLSELSIADDKKAPEQVMGLYKGKEMPLRLGLLIDTSNSQRLSKMYLPAVKAGSSFVSHLLTDSADQVFIVTFDTTPKDSGLMTRDEVQSFKVNIAPGGATALYDAIYLSCHEHMMNDRLKPVRRALVIISDGDDNQSHTSRAEAITAAQSTGTILFAISTGSQPNSDQVLARLASETGGYSYTPESTGEVSKAFADTQAEIEQMYSVTYRPAESGKPGDFHPIELKIPTNKKVKVRAPKGYYVPTF